MNSIKFIVFFFIVISIFCTSKKDTIEALSKDSVSVVVSNFSPKSPKKSFF